MSFFSVQNELIQILSRCVNKSRKRLFRYEKVCALAPEVGGAKRFRLEYARLEALY